jgi:hypothetical protein
MLSINFRHFDPKDLSRPIEAFVNKNYGAEFYKEIHGCVESMNNLRGELQNVATWKTDDAALLKLASHTKM